MRCKNIIVILRLFAYRLTHGIGSWQYRRSTQLSAMWELPHQISPIFCRGQCYSTEAPTFKCSFSIRIWLELELLVLALEPYSVVSVYHVLFLRSTDWQMSCHSRSNGQLWNAQICRRWIRWGCCASHVTPIFLSPQGRLHALKDYYHYLRDILASNRWSKYFSPVERNGQWVNSFFLLLYQGDS
jgi:hypothetical protein